MLTICNEYQLVITDNINKNTRNAFPQKNPNVITLQQQSAIAYYNLCNYSM